MPAKGVTTDRAQYVATQAAEAATIYDLLGETFGGKVQRRTIASVCATVAIEALRQDGLSRQQIVEVMTELVRFQFEEMT